MEHAVKSKILACLTLIALVTPLSVAAHAQIFSVIYEFKNGAFDGAAPRSGVTIKGSTLYGTTNRGGLDCGMNNGCGTVYQIRHVGSDWFETLIARFPSSEGGIDPLTRIVFGPDGHLYGTTSYNDFLSSAGTIYRLTPPLSICKTAACFSTANDIHLFTGGSEGSGPGGGDLIWDQRGNMYGTAGGGEKGAGIVFQMTGSGDNWTETPLYNFGSGQGDGVGPAGGVVMDSNGNLFGTTYGGGANTRGTVYELTYNPQAGWKETILYSFTGGIDGGNPAAGVILDSSGDLYGVNGSAIFELSPSGNTWAFKVLYQFPFPTEIHSNLSLDRDENLYGTTSNGGTFHLGSVYRLTKTDNGWVFNSLHDFTGGPDGAYPGGPVAIDTDGTLYGTSGYGWGNVWMIKP
jgi:uncharacterized repeat protein (TIGR03803 family)